LDEVEAGILHAFHDRWISVLGDALSTGLLPADYCALPEQTAAGFGPDVLTLQGPTSDAGPCTDSNESVATATLLQTRASIEALAVGQMLPDMPLFLEPHGCIMVPLQATYDTAFACMPGRWRAVLAPSAFSMSP